MAGPRKPGRPTRPARGGGAGRIARLLFTGCFALLFGVGGLLVIVLAVATSARRAAEVSDWQPVSVQVREVRLQTYDDSDAVSLHARYTYQVGGREFEGRAIGLHDGADNIGGWHQTWFDRLDDARRREAPVAGWFNPAHPEQALLDRRVRWELIGFRSIFALMVVAVGVAAGWAFRRTLRGETDTVVQLDED